MLENLINDLLDLAKMDNNSFQFSNDFFSLSNTVYEAFQMLGFSASEREVDLMAKIDSQINLSLIQSIHGDSRRFLQILLNFLSNALKFTDRGGRITVMINVIDHQLKQQSQVAEELIQGELSRRSVSRVHGVFPDLDNLDDQSLNKFLR